MRSVVYGYFVFMSSFMPARLSECAIHCLSLFFIRSAAPWMLLVYSVQTEISWHLMDKLAQSHRHFSVLSGIQFASSFRELYAKFSLLDFENQNYAILQRINIRYSPTNVPLRQFCLQGVNPINRTCTSYIKLYIFIRLH